MDDTKKMLRAIINGQSALKAELLKKIDDLDKKFTAKFDDVDRRFAKVDKRFDTLERNLTKRIDKLGRQLAYLEDDTPTREEHDELAKRVRKLEQKTASS